MSAVHARVRYQLASYARTATHCVVLLRCCISQPQSRIALAMATLPEDALGEPDPMRKDEDTETGVDAGAAAGAASGAADVAASEATHGPSGGLSAQRRVLRVLGA